MSNDYLRLNGGVTHWLEDTHGENLLYSVIDFYKWSFLEIGAYQNITRSPAVSGVTGGDKYRLGYVDDPRIGTGKVWQGYRSDWVWETGVSASPPPTSVNVYVNSTLKSSSEYYVDYPRGRVVFNSAIASGARVEANFAHRTVKFCTTDEPGFQRLMYDSHDISREDFLNSTQGGNWNQFAENRLQLPAVGIEVVGTEGFKPYQIGGGQWQYQKVVYYIYSENKTERDKLRDIFANQNDKIIWLYDRAAMKEHANWPFTLDYKGTPISGFWTYPSLVAEHNNLRYLNVRFMNTQAQNLEIKNNWLYGAVVSTTAELIAPYG